MNKSQLFPVLGFLMGWGAPSGAMALRYLLSGPSLPLWQFVREEWTGHSFFYWYMMIGTCLAGTLMGLVLGRMEEEADQSKNR